MQWRHLPFNGRNLLRVSYHNTPSQVLAAFTLNFSPDAFLTILRLHRKIREDLGFIAVDHTLEEIIVSFRGTVLRWEWLGNILRSRPRLWEATRCPGDCRVHSDWQDAEAEVKDAITTEIVRLLHGHPKYNITVRHDPLFFIGDNPGKGSKCILNYDLTWNNTS